MRFARAETQGDGVLSGSLPAFGESVKGARPCLRLELWSFSLGLGSPSARFNNRSLAPCSHDTKHLVPPLRPVTTAVTTPQHRKFPIHRCRSDRLRQHFPTRSSVSGTMSASLIDPATTVTDPQAAAWVARLNGAQKVILSDAWEHATFTVMKLAKHEEWNKMTEEKRNALVAKYFVNDLESLANTKALPEDLENPINTFAGWTVTEVSNEVSTAMTNRHVNWPIASAGSCVQAGRMRAISMAQQRYGRGAAESEKQEKERFLKTFEQTSRVIRLAERCGSLAEAGEFERWSECPAGLKGTGGVASCRRFIEESGIIAEPGTNPSNPTRTRFSSNPFSTIPTTGLKSAMKRNPQVFNRLGISPLSSMQSGTQSTSRARRRFGNSFRSPFSSNRATTTSVPSTQPSLWDRIFGSNTNSATTTPPLSSPLASSGQQRSGRESPSAALSSPPAPPQQAPTSAGNGVLGGSGFSFGGMPPGLPPDYTTPSRPSLGVPSSSNDTSNEQGMPFTSNYQPPSVTEVDDESHESRPSSPAQVSSADTAPTSTVSSQTAASRALVNRPLQGCLKRSETHVRTGEDGRLGERIAGWA